MPFGCSKPTPICSGWWAIYGIEDPFTELERLAGVCPPDVQVSRADRREPGRSPSTAGLWNSALPSACRGRSRVTWCWTSCAPSLLGDTESTRPESWRACDIDLPGAQGGAGATSVAINLALQLAETTKAKVALLDLHLQNGETAVMLGVRPGRAADCLGKPDAGRYTLFIERAAIQINDRVCLISADVELDAQLDIMREAGVSGTCSVCCVSGSFTSSSMCRCVLLHPSGDCAVVRAGGVRGRGHQARNARALRTAVTTSPVRMASLRCSTTQAGVTGPRLPRPWALRR